jgi:hypothetical protein
MKSNEPKNFYDFVFFSPISFADLSATCKMTKAIERKG